ncbi:MAG: small ribosomal subunit Rsm22 family protein [Hyphomicrobiales bacterium]
MRTASQALTAAYRVGGTSDSVDLAAYLAVRLPATHAAVLRVLAEVAARRPAFAPRTMLDAGAGPGTASWAATSIWSSLDAVTLVDRHRAFLALARDLAADHPVLARAHFLAGDLHNDQPQADLVVAAYALAEISAPRLSAVVDGLWASAEDTLVLVEPGTPAGFARLRLVRDGLLGQGAIPVAPCPHIAACPMTGDDWCHFSVRLARSRAHLHAKAARVPYEDEKFAYLAVSRGGAVAGGSRVLAPPADAKAGLGLKLCSRAGLATVVVSRRDRDAYRRLRRASWGDLIDQL